MNQTESADARIEEIRDRVKLARETPDGAVTEMYRRHQLGHSTGYHAMVFDDMPLLFAEIDRLRAIEQRATEEKRSHGDADPAHDVERQVWECMHYVLTGEDLDG